MPDVTLIDGPHDGETLSVNDGEWPQEILRFEDSLYRVDDVARRDQLVRTARMASPSA
jgi:hypothetical protein